MIKKISKIMWGLVIGFFLFAFIVGLVTHNTTLAYVAGYIVPLVFMTQIVLFAIGYLIKDKNA